MHPDDETPTSENPEPEAPDKLTIAESARLSDEDAVFDPAVAFDPAPAGDPEVIGADWPDDSEKGAPEKVDTAGRVCATHERPLSPKTSGKYRWDCGVGDPAHCVPA